MVLKRHPGTRGFMGDKYLVLGQLPETDHGGAIECQLANTPVPFGDNQPIGACILDRALHSRLQSQFLGAEELPTIHLTVHDPRVDIALGSSVGNRDGLQEVVLSKMRICVGWPVY